MFGFPKNSIPNVTLLEVETLGGAWSSGQILREWDWWPDKGGPRISLAPSERWRHKKPMTLEEPTPDPAGMLISNVQPPELWEINIPVVYKLAHLGHFAIAALMDKDPHRRKTDECDWWKHSVIWFQINRPSHLHCGLSCHITLGHQELNSVISKHIWSPNS